MSMLSPLLNAVAAPVKALASPVVGALTPNAKTSAGAPASQAVSAPASPAAMASLAAPTNAGATIAGAQQSLAGDQETFFKLLTAQLKNQDPLSPLDANQFTQQLVQMTGVQQQILTNQLLNQMVAGQSGVGNAVGLIGKSVTAATSAAVLKDGQADWTYSIPADAAEITFQVVDSAGNVVWQTTQSNVASGEHGFTWDGKDLLGAQRPDGKAFGLKVVAKDASGGSMTSNVSLTGVVTSIEMIGGETVVDINGVKVPMDLITGVRALA
ncbi:MAG TPA: flagellar hook assembly protein FlgD [Caulobacteraceae bacterium]|jgi:flagellar basal-body rod modification protein FlgD